MLSILGQFSPEKRNTAMHVVWPERRVTAAEHNRRTAATLRALYRYAEADAADAAAEAIDAQNC